MQKAPEISEENTPLVKESFMYNIFYRITGDNTILVICGTLNEMDK